MKHRKRRVPFPVSSDLTAALWNLSSLRDLYPVGLRSAPAVRPAAGPGGESRPRTSPACPNWSRSDGRRRRSPTAARRQTRIAFRETRTAPRPAAEHDGRGCCRRRRTAPKSSRRRGVPTRPGCGGRRGWTNSSSRTSHKTALCRIVFTWKDLPIIQEPREKGYKRAAAAVRTLYRGEGVCTVAVASLMGKKLDDGDTARMLRRAADEGLVRRIGRSGWEPMDEVQTNS